jgi:hypothetical protein
LNIQERIFYRHLDDPGAGASGAQPPVLVPLHGVQQLGPAGAVRRLLVSELFYLIFSFSQHSVHDQTLRKPVVLRPSCVRPPNSPAIIWNSE